MNQSLPGIKQFDLRGRVAVITGGSKGLGLAMGSGLASAGANIVLVSRNLQEGQQAAQTLTKYGVKASAISADVSQQLQMEAMANDVLDTYGRIDILINSAGINICLLYTSDAADD